MKRWTCLLVVLTLVSLAGCSANDPPASKSTSAAATSAAPRTPAEPAARKPAEPILRLRSGQLWDAYEENTIRADVRYQGKTLHVGGEVSVIEADWIGFSIVADDTRASIVCRIDPAHKAGFAAAEKGKGFDVIGVCKGAQERYGVYQNRVIILEQCRPGGQP